MSTDRRMTRLWERMAAMYGARWEMEYGPVGSPDGGMAPLAGIWMEALADVGNDALAAGLRRCMDRDAFTPPSLPEFLRLCGRSPRRNEPSHKLLPPTQQKPAPTETPAIRCAQLAAFLEETARLDLGERIRLLLPDDRRAAVRAYWLSRLVEVGGIGKAVAGTLKAAA